MADPWRVRQSPVQRLRTTQKTGTQFDLDGRLRQAAEVPEREFEESFAVPTCHVGTSAPLDTPRGRLWFDLDEPV